VLFASRIACFTGSFMASQRSAPFASLRRRRESLTNALARALPFCLLIGFGTVCARASMWIDPDWQQMLKESELIALVQVTEGGEFLAKVETLRSFKGQAPSTFYVVGFNNFNWPADAIALESFKKNQRYYLFLQREQALPYLEFLADTSSIILRYLPVLAAARIPAPLLSAKVPRSARGSETWPALERLDAHSGRSTGRRRKGSLPASAPDAGARCPAARRQAV
jgi:hypothetical protein